MAPRLTTFSLCAAIAACDPAPRGPPEPPPPLDTPIRAAGPRTLTTATEITTDLGATLTGPPGWIVTSRPGSVLLADPQREVTVTFVARKETDAATAIAAAWQQITPGGFDRKVRLATTPPARDGWDAVANVVYETTTAEQRSTWATARRKGDTWYVSLFDGTKSGWGRRFPQAQIADKSLIVPGLARESFIGKPAHALDATRLAALRSFVVEARRQLQIPGVAVAVVQGGEVVLAEGLGVRQLGKRAPVTADTLFRVASMSKPLTTLLMARLVDEGAFTWDTPLVTLLPGFALGDPETTRKLTMKYTVCACTGLPRQDLETIFDGAGKTAERMLAGMQRMTPTTGFGETYQYSNPLVAAGGYIAAHAARPQEPLNEAFRAVMADKIFAPLAMTRTTYDTAAAKKQDHAAAHAPTRDLVISSVPLTDDAWVDVWQPTGGAWSSAREYAQYLLLELADGETADGKRLVSAANLRARRAPQVRRSDSSSYGLGLVVEERDVPIYAHGGGLGGYSSYMFFMPEHGVGLVVLTNLGDAAAWHAPLRRKLLELLFDGKPEADEDLAFAVAERRAARAREAALVDVAPDVAWLQKHAGTWTSPELGEVTIKVANGKGVLDAGEWRSAIGRKTEDDGTVKIVLTSPPWSYEFLPGEANGAATLTLDAPQQRHVFTRR
jgi:CubicO group peptidase (beta-lactamase class C family)